MTWGGKEKKQMGMHGERKLNCTEYHWPEADVTIFWGEKILVRVLISYIIKLVDI